MDLISNYVRAQYRNSVLFRRSSNGSSVKGRLIKIRKPKPEEQEQEQEQESAD